MTLRDTASSGAGTPGDDTDTSTSAGHVAQQCLRECAGNWEEAAAAMRLRIDEDSELRDAILAPLIDGAIWDLIRAAAHRTRSAWVQTDEAIAGATNAAIRLRAAAASLYEWPLPGGMQLGKASREQVAEGAALYEQNASRNAARAKWLRAIEKKVKPGKSVAQSLSVAQLAKMRKEHDA